MSTVMIRKFENIDALCVQNIIAKKKNKCTVKFILFDWSSWQKQLLQQFNTSTCGLWSSMLAKKPSFPPRQAVSGLCVHDTLTEKTVYHSFDKFDFRGKVKNEFDYCTPNKNKIQLISAIGVLFINLFIIFPFVMILIWQTYKYKYSKTILFSSKQTKFSLI
jgi:hypothetical protein